MVVIINITMKKIIFITAFSLLFFLASCATFTSPPPVMVKEPDVINQPTKTVVAKDTIADVNRGTFFKTPDDEKVEVIVEQDTLVEVKDFDPKALTLENPTKVVLPKNTKVILPESTYLTTTNQTKMTLEATSEVILPVGTEITITKINWYAILFYCLLAFVSAWYYMYSKSAKEEEVEVKKPEPTKEEPPKSS